MRDGRHGSDPHAAFDPAAHAPSDFDVVAIAGDIDVPLTRSLEWIAERFASVPLVYVPGNHDFFVIDGEEAFTMLEMIEAGREKAARLGINLLLDDAVEIDGTRFVGGTLWTDMCLGAGTIGSHMSDAEGRMGMNDYRRIRRPSSKYPGKRKRIRPIDTIAAHKSTRNFIEATLAEPHDGPTVVVTHHAPHPQSLDPARKELRWCYASDMSLMLGAPTAPELWLHGHIHRAVDYQVGNTRVASNPRGYAFLPAERDNGFNPGLVIEVDPKPCFKHR